MIVSNREILDASMDVKIYRVNPWKPTYNTKDEKEKWPVPLEKGIADKKNIKWRWKTSLAHRSQLPWIGCSAGSMIHYNRKWRAPLIQLPLPVL